MTGSPNETGLGIWVSVIAAAGIIRTKVTEAVEIPILTRCCFCVPMRIGLIVFAYGNLVLTVLLTCLLSYYIGYLRISGHQDPSEYPRLIVDVTALCLETVLSVVFIVGLHKKHVLMMKTYLYFEIVFSVIGLIYSIAFMTKETASEVFIILFQLVSVQFVAGLLTLLRIWSIYLYCTQVIIILQTYLSILIWSLIVKMQRDGTVKYTREHDQA